MSAGSIPQPRARSSPARAVVRWLERLLNLNPGDLRRSVLLFFYLFLIIASYVIGKVARDALFLDRFKAVQLPYADIAIAVLVGFVVAAYVRVGRRTSVRNLLIGSSLLFSSNAALMWWLAHFYRPVWLYPVFYVWVGIFGVLAPAQVWTLANYVLTTREARRVFGIVGSGAIAGWIFSGLFTKQLVSGFGTEALMLVMAVFLCICAALVAIIWHRARAQAEAAAKDTVDSGAEPRNLRESIRLVASSPYLRSIASVIFFSSLVTTMVGWQFKAIARQNFATKDALAMFFGDFNFYAGVLSLGVQLLLTSRVLRRFGIGPALFAVPLALLGGTAGLLVSSSLAAVILLKGADQVLRYSIDKSTVELLYLPLASRVKVQAKWFIDTVIWRMGDGVAGVAVLVLATYLHVAATRLSWAVIVLIGCWLTAALFARRLYVESLKHSMQQHRMEWERASAPVLDRSTVEVLAEKLAAPQAEEVLYALQAFEAERDRAAHPAVRGLLDHPSTAVRRKALSIVTASGDASALPQVERLLADPDLEVRTEALLFLCRHTKMDPLARIEELGDYPDFSIRAATAAFLARPGDTQDLQTSWHILRGMVSETGPGARRMRLEAARLLGILPDAFDPLPAELLADTDVEIARAAIQSVGKLRKRRLVPDLLDRLANSELRAPAAEALAGFGDSILGALRDHLGDESVSLESRRQIPGILASIGTQEALRVLEANLLESDAVLRYEVICALNKLVRRHPQLEVDTQMAETVLAAELLGHYRSYQILDKLGPGADESLLRALKENLNREQERIFRLLSLLYRNQDLHSAYYGLQSKNPTVHDNALEFLDNILKPELRQLLVPLVDGQVTVAQRAALAARLVRANVSTTEEAVTALVCSDDSWLTACGAYAIGTLGLQSLEPYLNQCLARPDPLLRQAALEAKRRLTQTAAAKAV